MDNIGIKKIIAWILLIIGVFLPLLITIGSGDINLIDEGQFAAWVNNMLHGQVPYRDFFVQYGPFMIYPYYLSTKIFGISFFALRVWDIIQIGSAILGLLVMQKYLKVSKLYISLTYLACVLLPGVTLRYTLGIIIIFIYSVLCQRNKTFFSFLAGFLLALSYYTSLEMAIFTSFIIILSEILRFVISTNKKQIVNFILFLLSFLLTFLALYIIFYNLGFVTHYFSKEFEFIINLSGSNLPNGQGLPTLLVDNTKTFFGLLKILSKSSLFYVTFIFLTISLAILIIRFSITRKSNDIFMLLVSLYAILIYFSLIGRSGHYFNVFSICIFVFSYLLSIFHNSYEKHKRLLLSFVIVVFMVYLLRHILIFRFSIYDSLSLLSSKQNLERVGPVKITESQSDDISTIQKIISNNVKSNEKIYIFNNAPGIYFLVDRLNATTFDLPLLAGTLEGRLRLVKELKNSKPNLIIEDVKAWDVDGISDKKRMPEVFNYIQKNYKFKIVIGRYRIYSLKPILG